MNQEYEQPNVLTLDENSAQQEFNTFLQAEPNRSVNDQSPGEGKGQYNQQQQILNIQKKMIINQAKMNKKGERGG